MKISFVVTVYNLEHAWLKSCLESITAQQGDYELIVVDDGSRPETAAFCDALVQAIPQGRVIHQQNQGVCVARNTGAEACTGDYIAFIDGDDWIAPDYLQTVVPLLEEKPYDLLCFGYREHYAEESIGKTFGEDPLTEFSPEEKNGILGALLNVTEDSWRYPMFFGSQCTILFSTKLVREHNLRNVPGLVKSEDMVYVLYAVHAAKSIAYIPRELYHYEIHATGGNQGYKKDTGYYLQLIEEIQNFVRFSGAAGAVSQAGHWFALFAFDMLCRLHFFHPDNTASWLQKRKAFVSLLKEPAMVRVLSEVSGSCLTKAKKLQVFFLKCRSFLGITALYTLKKALGKDSWGM